MTPGALALTAAGNAAALHRPTACTCPRPVPLVPAAAPRARCHQHPLAISSTGCALVQPPQSSAGSSTVTAPAAGAAGPTAPAKAATPTGDSSTTVTTVMQRRDVATGPAVLDGINTLILDCDGVLWTGSTTVHNAAQALHLFRERGIRLLFVTNNSSKSREAYVAKFRGLGLDVDASEIVSSSYAATAYLGSVGFKGKVLLLGPVGVEDELRKAGIEYVGGPNFVVPPMDDTDAMKALQVDPEIRAVVVGWDPVFSYSRLVYASVCLRELPGCTLVATNLDHGDNIGNGRMMPGTGGLVAAVEVASGVKAVNVGKGGEWLLPFLCQQYNLDPSKTAIIGDRLDTDIALGKAGGLVTILPLTGVTTDRDLAAAPAAEVPDFVIPSIAALAGLPTSPAH